MPIHTGFVESNLSGYLYKFSTLGIHAVLNREKAFQPVNEIPPNLGKDHRYHWIRFAIQNRGSKPQSVISNLHFKEISNLSFYVVDAQNRVRYRQEHLGRSTLISDKPILTRDFAFPVEIAPDSG